MDENVTNPPDEPSAEEAKPPEDAQPAEPSKEVSKDACMWGMLCHLLGIFTWFIGPLIVWLIKKEEDPFIDTQGKEALNFQITLGIGYVGFAIVFCLAFLIPVVWVVGLVFAILASVKTNKGVAYRYPVSIRLIK